MDNGPGRSRSHKAKSLWTAQFSANIRTAKQSKPPPLSALDIPHTRRVPMDNGARKSTSHSHKPKSLKTTDFQCQQPYYKPTRAMRRTTRHLALTITSPGDIDDDDLLEPVGEVRLGSW